jgi:hypothetical protein
MASLAGNREAAAQGWEVNLQDRLGAAWRFG